MSLTNITTAIKTRLDQLVTDTVIAKVEHDDFGKSSWERDFSAYPVAILSTPLVESEELTNGENLRAYTYEVMFIFRGEDITSATYIEGKMAAVLDEFDQNYTLGGAADGGMVPSMTQATPIVAAGDRSLITFVLILKVKESISLNN